MAKKKRRLDQFLNPRGKNAETELAERAQLANRLFRLAVGGALTFALAVLARPPDLPYSTGLGLFLTMLTLLGGSCLHRLQPGIFDRPSSFNKFVLLVCLTVAAHRLLIVLEWSPLLVPLPLFAMVTALAFSQGTSLISVLAVGFILGLISPRISSVPLESADQSGLPYFLRFDLPLTLAVTAGAVVCTLQMRRVREQSKPVVIGVYAGIVQGFMVLAMELMAQGFSLERLIDTVELKRTLHDPGWAMVGGLLSGGILTCLLPPLERFFNFVTERRLLELADPSNEVLRVLRERAPGTYHHTLNVSQLAGNAAEAIGADRLLAEVGAFYHDIGKIHKPEYFVENMGEDKSIHDRLRPHMSKMIIVSHVKDGILFAREEKLPQKIIDMIPMHHGTTVVEYFFQKARRAAEKEEDTLSDIDFRYPGPKPRFREAGILMLADMVEAIAKTEAEPNPSRFRAMVHDQILKRLLDGQLDESDLTLNDLRVIEESFVRTLTTMYHGRIKYPPNFDSGRVSERPGGDSPQSSAPAEQVAALAGVRPSKPATI